MNLSANAQGMLQHYRTELAAAYGMWAEREREPKISPKLIGTRVAKRRGVTEERTQQSRWWIGIGLRADDDEDDDEPPPKAENAVTRDNDTYDTFTQSVSRKVDIENRRENVSHVSRAAENMPDAPSAPGRLCDCGQPLAAGKARCDDCRRRM